MSTKISLSSVHFAFYLLFVLDSEQTHVTTHTYQYEDSHTNSGDVELNIYISISNVNRIITFMIDIIMKMMLLNSR